MCHNVANGGTCQLGDNCRFRHADTLAEQTRVNRVRTAPRPKDGKAASAVLNTGFVHVVRRWGDGVNVAPAKAPPARVSIEQMGQASQFASLARDDDEH